MTPTRQQIDARIADYLAGPGMLRSGAWGLTEVQLNTRCAPGTWSIQEVIVHILDADLSATHRMRRLAAEFSPVIAAFDENALITNLDSKVVNTQEALDLFDLNRRFTARWLKTLPVEAFARTGVHTQRGTISLWDVLDTYTGHVPHHDAFVKGKRKAMGAA